MPPHRIIAMAMVLASAALAGEKSPHAEKPPIITPADWGSTPQPIPDSRKHTPKFITIHHAGVVWKAGQDPAKFLRTLQAWVQKEKHWPDLPYHFLIAPVGLIFAGRPVEYEPETNTTYKTAGHIGVELFGNFEVQRPSQAQLESLVKLTAWLAQQYKIPLDAIGGHKDRAETACPGRDLYRYFKDGQLKSWIQTAMAGKSPEIQPGPALQDGPTEVIPLN
jgi:hypothetical protein